MSPAWWVLRVIAHFEVAHALCAPLGRTADPRLQDSIVNAILRRPGFHRAVGRVHRAVNERIHGRSPHEPLAPGEATADPRAAGRRSFLRFFVDELRNQSRGRPTDLPKDK